MKKKGLLLILGTAAVVAAVLFFLLISNLDDIVKGAIEKYGSRATRTAVTVASVRLNIRDGEGSIHGLSIGNPGGFSAPHAFNLEAISLAIDTASVRNDPVIIEKVQISGPWVIYEVDPSGKSNMQEINKNLGLEKRSGQPAGEGKKGREKKIIIKDFIIENGRVEIRVAALPGEPIFATLPKIHLKNLGGRGGETPSEIATQVLAPLVDRAMGAAADAGVQRYLGKSREEVKRMVEQKAKEQLGEMGEDATKETEGVLKKFLGK